MISLLAPDRRIVLESKYTLEGIIPGLAGIINSYIVSSMCLVDVDVTLSIIYQHGELLRCKNEQTFSPI